jgi:hypothetical protein
MGRVRWRLGLGEEGQETAHEALQWLLQLEFVSQTQTDVTCIKRGTFILSDFFFCFQDEDAF